MSDDLPDVSRDYTPAELDAELQAGFRFVRYRYQILTNEFVHKGYLAGVEPGGRVSYQYLADIKRECSMSVIVHPASLMPYEIEWADVEETSDFIRPLFQLRMPNDLWASWPLGTFIMDAGPREAKDGLLRRTIEGFDLGTILDRDLEPTDLSIASGTVVTDKVKELLADAGIDDTSLIDDSPETLSSTKDWDAGTRLGTVVNEILDMIGYGSLFFNELGQPVAKQYQVPSDRLPTVSYLDTVGTKSRISRDGSEVIDLRSVPNKWVGVVSTPSETVLVSTITNDRADSPTSTVNRGYIVTDHRTDLEATSQGALDVLVRKIAAEASQVYRELTFNTAVMPTHGEATMMEISHSILEIEKENYMETAWEIPLEPGALMSHSARRAVMVDDLTS